MSGRGGEPGVIVEPTGRGFGGGVAKGATLSSALGGDTVTDLDAASLSSVGGPHAAAVRPDGDGLPAAYGATEQ